MGLFNTVPDYQIILNPKSAEKWRKYFLIRCRFPKYFHNPDTFLLQFTVIFPFYILFQTLINAVYCMQ